MYNELENELEYLRSINHIEEVNKTIVRQQEYQQNLVGAYLVNKENSLENRWEVWTKYSQTNSGNYIHHFPKEYKDFENHFYEDQDRYLTIDYEEILESYDDYLVDTNIPEPVQDSMLNSMKEYLMEQNLRSYKYDW